LIYKGYLNGKRVRVVVAKTKKGTYVPLEIFKNRYLYSIISIIMHSNYELFIEALLRIASEENGNILPEDYETSHLWRYSSELFHDQKVVVEAILALGYTPIYARLRETLS
jgi:hypothetical protein